MYTLCRSAAAIGSTDYEKEGKKEVKKVMSLYLKPRWGWGGGVSWRNSAITSRKNSVYLSFCPFYFGKLVETIHLLALPLFYLFFNVQCGLSISSLNVLLKNLNNSES